MENRRMGKVKNLVDRQHDMLRRRDVQQVASLYTADGYYMLPGFVSPRRSFPP